MPLVPEVVVSVLPAVLEPDEPGLAPMDDELPVVPLVDGVLEGELLLDEGLVVEGLVVEGLVVDDPDAPMELLSDDGLVVLPDVEGLVLLPDAPMVLDEPVPWLAPVLGSEPPVDAPAADWPLLLPLPDVPLLEDWATA